MAAKYSHKQFFRKVKNALLEQYLDQKGIDFGIDLQGVKENDVNVIFTSFIALDENTN